MNKNKCISINAIESQISKPRKMLEIHCCLSFFLSLSLCALVAIIEKFIESITAARHEQSAICMVFFYLSFFHNKT